MKLPLPLSKRVNQKEFCILSRLSEVSLTLKDLEGGHLHFSIEFTSLAPTKSRWIPTDDTGLPLTQPSISPNCRCYVSCGISTQTDQHILRNITGQMTSFPTLSKKEDQKQFPFMQERPYLRSCLRAPSIL